MGWGMGREVERDETEETMKGERDRERKKKRNR